MYRVDREAQALECSEWLRSTCKLDPKPDFVVYGGDFNTMSKEFGHEIIETMTGLKNTCPNPEGGMWTWAHPSNSFTSPGELKQKIDHIFVGDPSGVNKSTAKDVCLPFLGKRLPLGGVKNSSSISLSDHEALKVDLEITYGTQGTPVKAYSPNLKDELAVYKSVVELFKRDLSTVEMMRMLMLGLGIFLALVATPYLALFSTTFDWFTTWVFVKGFLCATAIFLTSVAFYLFQKRWYALTFMLEKYSLKISTLQQTRT